MQIKTKTKGAALRRFRQLPFLVATACLLIPAQAVGANRGLALGWQGYADTDLQFSEFLGSEHTIAFRFMPQYPNAYEGPIIAENGTGTFVIGQGDFMAGTDAPKLFVQVGSKKMTFTP